MNSLLSTCDRATHLRIVAVALVTSIVVVVAAAHARISETGGLTAGADPSALVVKAGKQPVYSTRGDLIIR
jgi:hypothetical protein